MLREYKIILLCARLNLDSPAQQELKKLLRPSVDWGKIIKTAKQQEILPFLCCHLNHPDFQNSIPQKISTKLKHYYHANMIRNLLYEREISAILKITNSRNIDIMPFKGFALIQTLYNNPAIRNMVDVDILIKENDFQEIKNIFGHAGYKINETVLSKMLRPKEYIVIEIHSMIVPPRPYKINHTYLWERAKEINLNGRKLLCLSDEDTFLSLALHLRRHTRRLTLKFIVDIAELLNKVQNNLGWPYIIKSAKGIHIMATIYTSLYLSKELLDSYLPDDKILNEFRPGFIKRTAIRFIVNKRNFFELKKWRGTLLRILLFDSPKDFLLYLWRVSFLEKILGKRL